MFWKNRTSKGLMKQLIIRAPALARVWHSFKSLALHTEYSDTGGSCSPWCLPLTSVVSEKVGPEMWKEKEKKKVIKDGNGCQYPLGACPPYCLSLWIYLFSWSSGFAHVRFTTQTAFLHVELERKKHCSMRTSTTFYVSLGLEPEHGQAGVIPRELSPQTLYECVLSSLSYRLGTFR